MTEVCTGRSVRSLSATIDLVLLAGLLLATVGSAGVSSPPAAHAPFAVARSSVPAPAPTAELSVDPATFWMSTGANVTLRAVWSIGSPLCGTQPLWYRWSVAGGVATGFLNASNGSSVVFTADSFYSGVVTVTANSGTVLLCGANERVVIQTAGTNLSVWVPLSVSGIKVGTDPLRPGENTTLGGAVTGGEPPYSVTIQWGDGTNTTFRLSAPGSFARNHSFAAGEFLPYLLVSDSAGGVANVSADEELSVSTGFEVAIVSPDAVAEVGLPVEFVGVAENPPAGAVRLYDCSNATTLPTNTSDGGANDTPFACRFRSPGMAEVVFGVYAPQPGGPSASAVLYETVAASPRVGVVPSAPVGEVGNRALVRVTLSGGALPIVLSWNLSGNRSGGHETVPSDGGGVLALPLEVAGEYGIGVRASDAVGTIAANDSAALEVDPPLIVNASVGRFLQSNGAVAVVAGNVRSGCPPFTWWVVPYDLPGNGTPEGGTLGTAGAFVWNGSFAQEGNLSIRVGVVDGCGVMGQTSLTTGLVPPLAVETTVSAGTASPNETLAVNVSIQGGLAPYRLWVNASDNGSWNRTVPSAGWYEYLVPASGNGSLRVTTEIADSLGIDVVSNFTIVLVRPPVPTPPPSTAPPPPADAAGSSNNSTAADGGNPLWLLVILVPTSGGAAVFLLLRRRRSRAARRTVAGPDPVATLRHIIEPAEGAERFTVELLAEEAGIPLAVVRSTIDRLVSEGTVRSESGADGEEVLSWSPEPGP